MVNLHYVQMSISGHMYNLILIYIPVRIIECELYFIMRHFCNLTNFSIPTGVGLSGSIYMYFILDLERKSIRNMKIRTSWESQSMEMIVSGCYDIVRNVVEYNDIINLI